ncbi:MAG: hypothetical protein OXT65_06135 [Alphaproteobacteria bacterium]|nr:hypothetical protein [Alphaproteobacteria bacterium]
MAKQKKTTADSIFEAGSGSLGSAFSSVEIVPERMIQQELNQQNDGSLGIAKYDVDSASLFDNPYDFD